MKGSIGTATTLHRLKKPDKIPCDCNYCRHCKKSYCSYYDIVNPKKKVCARYWGKPIKKKTVKRKRGE